MLRRFIETVVVLSVLVVVALLGAARLWHEPDTGIYWKIAEWVRMPKDLGAVDFVALERRAMPSASDSSGF